MTAREIVYGLQDQLVRLFGNVIYDIETSDLLYYLNKAQNDIIKDKVLFFEQTQYITDELRTLVKDEVIIPTVNQDKIISKLPNDYNILVKHRCSISSDDSCGDLRNVPGLLVKTDNIYQLLKDPFWKPSIDEPLYYILGDDIIYENPDLDLNISRSEITYIKQEDHISLSDINGVNDVDSELPEFIHDEIINRAKSLIIEDKQLNLNN